MLGTQHPTTLPSAPPVHPGLLGHAPQGRVMMAKWPPDDVGGGAPMGGGGVPAGGGFDSGDGNFKKGRFSPALILVAIVAVAGFAAFMLLGVKQDAKRLTVEESVAQKKAIFVLPKAEQIPKWRVWAAADTSDLLRQEALKQLAWAGDPEGVKLAAQALSAPTEPVQAMAATALAEYGLPAAESAKAALLAALKTAGPGAKPQIAWALVTLRESSAFEEVMKLYRLGHLAQVQRLGGGSAFDPNKLVELTNLEKLAGLAGDPSPSVRQLVATVLSANAEPKWTEALIKLVQDKDPEVARQAAPGLGRIGDEAARKPLLDALKATDKDSRKKYLEALRDGIGARGLVMALESSSADEKLGWYHHKEVFDMIDLLADMRGADALYGFLESKPHVHWQTRAATALAAIGDLRAAPTLAKRLRMDPLKIYSDEYDWEQLLKRDDNERVVAARMLADLAILHPDKVEQLREQTEEAVIFWLHELPSPHANGLRALAAMDSRRDIDALRKWSNPELPLPKEGQQPPMPEEWVIAQSALRYVGWLKDERSWGVMEKALMARPAEQDVTMDGLMQGGLAILGMTLRALGVGAAEGMSQWRDPKGFKPLLDHIEDVRNNEQSRMAACSALAWVATKDDILKVAEKIGKYSSDLKSDQFRRACLLETLIQRPVPGTAAALMSLMTEASAIETRHQVARAIAKGGFDASVEAQLFEMLKNEALMNDAALALILGGTPETAARTVATYADQSQAAIRDLADLWYRSFGYWSYEDLESGLIFKWVDNAVAISRVSIKETPQEWGASMLVKQFENLSFDNGPHSFTRVVLRSRLYAMAKGDDPAKRDGALRALKFMKEQGVLLALRDESGEIGKLGREAYHDLMNPKFGGGGIAQEVMAENE